MSQKNIQSLSAKRPSAEKISQDEFNALITFLEPSNQALTATGTFRANRSRRQVADHLVAWLRTLKKSGK